MCDSCIVSNLSFSLYYATKELVNIKVEHVLTQYFLGFSVVIPVDFSSGTKVSLQRVCIIMF